MGALLVPLLFLIMALGVPVSFSMGITALIGFVALGKTSLMSAIPQTLFAGVNSFPILAMPLFMLAGEIMVRAGITQKLVKLADEAVGHMAGGLGHVNVLGSMFFAGISGSAVADVSALGPIEISLMAKGGYDVDYSAALTAASAVIGPIIPPSIIMVIYGSMMNVSIAGMFAGGMLPGILIGLGLMIMNWSISTKRHYPRREHRVPIGQLAKTFLSSASALIMPAIILGGILGGIFTPTEAAAVAVLYAIVVGVVVYRKVKLVDVIDSLKAAFTSCGTVLIIVAAGSLLAWLFTMEHVPETVATIFTSMAGNNKYVMLLIINALLLIVGMFMDITAALIILAPVLAPLAIKLGVDPMHFGVMMCINLNIGLITPPLGAVLFVTSAVSKVKVERIVAQVVPFIFVEVAVLGLVTYFPWIVLAIPKALGLAY